jgi:hypothetical protein
MSTISKEIADKIIAGEFAEDNIVAIVKYNNAFNGADAYKIYTSRTEHLVDFALMGGEPFMLNASLYWEKKDA